MPELAHQKAPASAEASSLGLHRPLTVTRSACAARFWELSVGPSHGLPFRVQNSHSSGCSHYTNFAPACPTRAESVAVAGKPAARSRARFVLPAPQMCSADHPSTSERRRLEHDTFRHECVLYSGQVHNPAPTTREHRVNRAAWMCESRAVEHRQMSSSSLPERLAVRDRQERGKEST